MTGAELLSRTRFLLHDTGRGASTSSRFYTDTTILRALNVAQADVAHALITAPQRAEITVSRLLTSVDSGISGTTFGTTGVAVPSDFWLLECGETEVGQYVPKESLHVGEAWRQETRNDLIYAQAGLIFGTAFTAHYWKIPTAIANSGTTLTLFSDAFYHTVKFLACRELVAQEDKDAVDRWTYFNKEFLRKLQTLK